MPEGTCKRFCHGTERVCHPQETLRRIEPLAKQAGITRVANVTGLDRIGIPVTMVVRPASRSVSVSQGKGATLEAARVSGLMEAFELHHAELFSGPLRLGSYRQLSQDLPLADPLALPRPSTSPWHEELSILWAEGQKLTSSGFMDHSDSIDSSDSVWVPAEMVDVNYVLPRPMGSGCFHNNTNGLASGNTPVEALCHGLCEVIERHSITSWMQGSPETRAATGLNLNGIDDPICRRYLDLFAQADLTARVWDVTSPVGVPAYSCRLYENSPTSGAISWADGAGCHPRPAVALARALAEAAQSRLTLIAGSRDDLAPDAYIDAWQLGSWPPKQATEHEDLPPPTRTLDPSGGWQVDTFEEDLAEILRRLQEAGSPTVAAFDLTRADFDIPVFRVVVPGLLGMTGSRHHWVDLAAPSRSAPGRSGPGQSEPGQSRTRQ